MGALHEGHLQLVRCARKKADVVAVSIFVNPTQFGPNEDFDRYPRVLDADLELLDREGVSIVFAPSVAEMYPDGFQTMVEPGAMAQVLDGAARPGHFRGVATVCAKLFSILNPDFAVMGQKDYQQFLIVRQMAEDLNLPVQILAHPIVREPDGLAMSSRNRYLNARERAQAVVLRRSLDAAGRAIASGEADPDAISAEARKVFNNCPDFLHEYFVAVDPDTLAKPREDWNRIVCLVAGRMGSTRLIDNALFSRSGEEETL
jgi:pantoate--beta-alanine ligase